MRVFFNQVLKPQTNQKTKLFLAEPSEFLEKNHAEFFQDFKKLIILFQENSRDFSLVFCESETLLLRLLDFCKSLSRKNLLKVFFISKSILKEK